MISISLPDRLDIHPDIRQHVRIYREDLAWLDEFEGWSSVQAIPTADGDRFFLTASVGSGWKITDLIWHVLLRKELRDSFPSGLMQPATILDLLGVAHGGSIVSIQRTADL